MDKKFSLFLIVITVLVIGVLYWNMTKGSSYTTSSMTPRATPGFTIPPQLDAKPLAAKTVTNQTIRNLNRLYGNGKLPTNSSYAQLHASGQVKWNPAVKSWQATSGSAVGYTGVGNASAQDIRNLNRLYPTGNISPGSRLWNLAASGKAGFVNGGWQQIGGSSGPTSSVTNQTIRNLNRMYGNGKMPTKSDYAGLYASGQVTWNPQLNSWQATSGSSVGYKGVGNANSQEIANLNRLYPTGNITPGSRFWDLVAAKKAVYTGNGWTTGTGITTMGGSTF